MDSSAARDRPDWATRRVAVLALTFLVVTGGLMATAAVTEPQPAATSRLPAMVCFDEAPAGYVSPSFGSGHAVDRPCTQPHVVQSIATFELPPGPDGAYPSWEAMQAVTARICRGAFEVTFGQPWTGDDVVALDGLWPEPEVWNAGDRMAYCIVMAHDGRSFPGLIGHDG